MDGDGGVEELRHLGRDIPLILFTGELGDERAVECVKAGAVDYLLKTGNLPEPAFDMASVLARVEGDKSLLKELAQIFRTEVPGVLAEIRRCVATSNSAGLERAAHGFRGACGNFGAGAAVRAAHALELMGRRASFEDVEARVADLVRETDILELALVSIGKNTS